jgi:antitoxin PrlF
MGIESKITTKGQTTIPVEVRKALGVSSGDVISYEIDGSEVKLVKKRSALELAGILYDPKRPALTIEQMKAWPDAAVERFDEAVNDRN